MSEHKYFLPYLQLKETLWQLEQAFLLIEACIDTYCLLDADNKFKAKNQEKIRYFTDLYYDKVKELLPTVKEHLQELDKFL